MQDPIITAFYKKMAGVSFEAYGILDSDNKIHTLGTDSKLIGRILKCSLSQFLKKSPLKTDILLKPPQLKPYTPISSC